MADVTPRNEFQEQGERIEAKVLVSSSPSKPFHILTRLHDRDHPGACRASRRSEREQRRKVVATAAPIQNKPLQARPPAELQVDKTVQEKMDIGQLY